MKQTLIKHYGKILLTVLLLGVSAYFGVDTSKLQTAVSNISETSAPDAGPDVSADASK